MKRPTARPCRPHARSRTSTSEPVRISVPRPGVGGRLDRPLLDDPVREEERIGCHHRARRLAAARRRRLPRPHPALLYGGAREARDPLTSCTDGWVPLTTSSRPEPARRKRRSTRFRGGPRDVVRTYKRQHWVYWQLGLTDGSRYDVKSFTVTTPYYVLIPRRPHRQRREDHGGAEWSARPQGTVPKTDAAEFPAAYSPPGECRRVVAPGRARR